MGLAPGHTARDRCANARSILGIDSIEIEADMNARGARGCQGNRVASDAVHPVAIDISHGKDVRARPLEQLALAGVDLARADDDDAVWVDMRATTSHLDQRRITHRGVAIAAERAKNHAVDIARWAGLRRIEVGMGVEPDDAGRIDRVGDAAAGAERDAMVAAENDRR